MEQQYIIFRANPSPYARIYHEILTMPVGGELTYTNLSRADVDKIRICISTNKRRGKYGEGVSVPTKQGLDETGVYTFRVRKVKK